MEFVQLQINYLDWASQWVQSKACYETAVKHGKPVIVMEPVKGGTLADIIRSNIAIPCTGCSYCTEGCPKHIAIPNIFLFIMRMSAAFTYYGASAGCFKTL